MSFYYEVVLPAFYCMLVLVVAFGADMVVNGNDAFSHFLLAVFQHLLVM